MDRKVSITVCIYSFIYVNWEEKEEEKKNIDSCSLKKIIINKLVNSMKCMCKAKQSNWSKRLYKDLIGWITIYSFNSFWMWIEKMNKKKHGRNMDFICIFSSRMGRANCAVRLLIFSFYCAIACNFISLGIRWNHFLEWKLEKNRVIKKLFSSL